MFNVIAKIDDLIYEMDCAAMKGDGMAHYGYCRLVEIRSMLLTSKPKPEDVQSKGQIPQIIRDHIDRGAKINAIKEARVIFNLGLKDAKDLVEKWIEDYYPEWVSSNSLVMERR